MYIKINQTDHIMLKCFRHTKNTYFFPVLKKNCKEFEYSIIVKSKSDEYKIGKDKFATEQKIILLTV